MAPKKRTSRFANEDAPWRALKGEKPVPRINKGGVVAVRQGANYQYAISIMKHPDPIGYGLAREAYVEPAGPDCIIPGLQRPVKVLGLQVWPIPFKPVISLKALEPIGRELKTVGKLLDKAFDLMQAPFSER
ncbi:uncharacterized protein [Physcomitrium patens]|uniref:uncharacterized protein n=1 Tax=Physcomitrium patens TaxID=3218 RepID=UPI00016266A6|nr:uncharacterized protein LOC112278986 [Physcomitrium patens]XP_024368742.1 uncharacterized protein LOC112278986 [Physcomitrium patens]XP_024368744.1 uncharacterized protein LOC112278986 [Physcomitrium patens]XP_024368745.1 uncharacterized protein LOC112278986 [Physcomitrium patens]|eukprot:XP_024368741.1 uncharacterized protein LOC112278986 [Physcomitrella patens]